jgi:uncharacterized protein YbaR (Trm112 family)
LFIELSEALVCPACGPPQGLVVVVDRLDGRRVIDGFLGCPICEARFPIRTGIVDLAHPTDAVPPLELDPEQTAVMIAALFDIRDGDGYILLDEALGPVAAGVAEMTGGCEVIALAGTEYGHSEPGDTHDAWNDPLAPGTSRVAGAGRSLPVQSGRLRALAVGQPTEARLRDAIRALAPEGRLVVVQPTAETRELLRELPVQPLADEAMAFLGVVAPTA